jgi:hypothetical protein
MAALMAESKVVMWVVQKADSKVELRAVKKVVT